MFEGLGIFVALNMESEGNIFIDGSGSSFFCLPMGILVIANNIFTRNKVRTLYYINHIKYFETFHIL